jgi:hypothetical protein
MFNQDDARRLEILGTQSQQAFETYCREAENWDDEALRKERGEYIHAGAAAAWHFWEAATAEAFRPREEAISEMQLAAARAVAQTVIYNAMPGNAEVLEADFDFGAEVIVRFLQKESTLELRELSEALDWMLGEYRHVSNGSLLKDAENGSKHAKRILIARFLVSRFRSYRWPDYELSPAEAVACLAKGREGN